MVDRAELELVLDAAFAGVSRVADFIVSLPDDDRPTAFAAAERSYFSTVRQFAGSDGEALGWAASLLMSLRSEVELRTQGRDDAA